MHLWSEAIIRTDKFQTISSADVSGCVYCIMKWLITGLGVEEPSTADNCELNAMSTIHTSSNFYLLIKIFAALRNSSFQLLHLLAIFKRTLSEW